MAEATPRARPRAGAGPNPFKAFSRGPGGHCLLTYTSQEQATPTFAAFLEEGLARGDRCLYLSEDPVWDRERLKSTGLPLDKIEFRSLADWYLTQGRFQAQKPLTNWLTFVEEALAQGHAGATAVADVGSFFVRRGEMKDFVAYEGTAQEHVPNLKLRVICAYTREALPEPYFSGLVGAHQVVAYGVTEEGLARYRRDFPGLDFAALGRTAPFEDVDFCAMPSPEGYFVAPAGESQETPLGAMARIYRHLFEQAVARRSQALQREQEGEALREAVGRIWAVASYAGDLDLPAVLGNALKAVVEALPVEGAWINIFDPSSLGPGLVAEEGLKDVSGCLSALTQKVAQAGALLHEADQEVLLSGEALRACLVGFPVTIGHGAEAKVKGAMVLASRQKALEEPWQHEHLLRLGGQVGLVLERAQLQRESQTHSLTASMVIQASADGILVVSAQQRVESVNPALERITGFAREELEGKPCPHLLGTRLPDGRHTCDSVCPFLNPLVRGPNIVEVNISAREGGQRWAELAFGPMYDNMGQLIGVVHTVRDITSRKEAERLKENFLALVSHELRSPLTVIMGMASTLLHKEMSLVGIARSGLKDIVAQARRLNGLVDNLLIMTLGQTGNLGLAPEYLRVEKLAAKVVKASQGQGQGQRCSFVLDFPPDFPPALADPARLELVLRNLVENAVKYSPEGGDIRIWGRREDSVLTIGVEDQGIGISQEHLEDVFKGFHRLQDPRVQAKPGVGLGLAVCQRVVEAHGGRIWAESEPGRGTVFTFSLPHLDPSASL